MKKRIIIGLDFIIDKLTNSIENTLTGEVFDTEIVKLKAFDIKPFKEPKNVDLSTKSEPWTEEELADFRKIMQEIKAKNAKRNVLSSRLKGTKKQPA